MFITATWPWLLIALSEQKNVSFTRLHIIIIIIIINLICCPKEHHLPSSHKYKQFAHNSVSFSVNFKFFLVFKVLLKVRKA
jgi:hypothetical protein